jgi:hypothetical protein
MTPIPPNPLTLPVPPTVFRSERWILFALVEVEMLNIVFVIVGVGTIEAGIEEFTPDPPVTFSGNPELPEFT